jgi:hypothetical protein
MRTLDLKKIYTHTRKRSAVMYRRYRRILLKNLKPVSLRISHIYTYVSSRTLRIRVSALVLALILIVGGFAVISKPHIQAATFGWIQSSWSGGANVNATALHEVNLVDWNVYATKDQFISAGDQVSLSTSSASLVDTADADFNQGTKTNVAPISGTLYMLKQNGASCSANNQCVSNSCVSNICGGL